MYFDPGSGSIIIQVLLATIATISTLIYTARNKIASILKKDKKVPAEGSDKYEE